MTWIYFCLAYLAYVTQLSSAQGPPIFGIPPAEGVSPEETAVTTSLAHWLNTLSSVRTAVYRLHVQYEQVAGTGTATGTSGIIKTLYGREALDNLWGVQQILSFQIETLDLEVQNFGFLPFFAIRWQDTVDGLLKQLALATKTMLECQVTLKDREQLDVFELADETNRLITLQVDVMSVFMILYDPAMAPSSINDPRQDKICDTLGEIRVAQTDLFQIYQQLVLSLNAAFDDILSANRDRTGYPYAVLADLYNRIRDFYTHVNSLEPACVYNDIVFFERSAINRLKDIQDSRTSLYNSALDIRVAVSCLDEAGVSQADIDSIMQLLTSRDTPAGTLNHLLRRMDGKIISMKIEFVDIATP